MPPTAYDLCEIEAAGSVLIVVGVHRQLGAVSPKSSSPGTQSGRPGLGPYSPENEGRHLPEIPALNRTPGMSRAALRRARGWRARVALAAAAPDRTDPALPDATQRVSAGTSNSSTSVWRRTES